MEDSNTMVNALFTEIDFTLNRILLLFFVLIISVPLPEVKRYALSGWILFLILQVE